MVHSDKSNALLARQADPHSIPLRLVVLEVREQTLANVRFEDLAVSEFIFVDGGLPVESPTKVTDLLFTDTDSFRGNPRIQQAVNNPKRIL